MTGGSLCSPSSIIGTARLDLTLGAGTYLVEVSDSANDQTGAYTLVYQTVQDSTPPSPLTLDEAQQVVLNRGESRSYRVTLPAGAPNLFVTLQKNLPWSGALTVVRGSTVLASTSGSVDHILQMLAPAAGDYVIRASGSAFDKEGRFATLGTKTITVDNAHANKPFGSIDTPTYGQAVSGSFWNYGWALTPPP